MLADIMHCQTNLNQHPTGCKHAYVTYSTGSQSDVWTDYILDPALPARQALHPVAARDQQSGLGLHTGVCSVPINLNMQNMTASQQADARGAQSLQLPGHIADQQNPQYPHAAERMTSQHAELRVTPMSTGSRDHEAVMCDPVVDLRRQAMHVGACVNGRQPAMQTDRQPADAHGVHTDGSSAAYLQQGGSHLSQIVKYTEPQSLDGNEPHGDNALDIAVQVAPSPVRSSVRAVKVLSCCSLNIAARRC